MSYCLENAEEFRGKMVQVVQTKTSLVVAIFFGYCVYVVCMMGKHCLAKSENETRREIAVKLGKVQHDIVGKSFFLFMLTMVCTQVQSSIYSSIMVYLYIGALAAQFLGSMLSGNVVMRKLRHIGLLMVGVLCCFLYWGILVNEWCTMFYFKSVFSLNYKS